MNTYVDISSSMVVDIKRIYAEHKLKIITLFIRNTKMPWATRTVSFCAPRQYQLLSIGLYEDGRKRTKYKIKKITCTVQYCFSYSTDSAWQIYIERRIERKNGVVKQNNAYWCWVKLVTCRGLYTHFEYEREKNQQVALEVFSIIAILYGIRNGLGLLCFEIFNFFTKKWISQLNSPKRSCKWTFYMKYTIL